MSPLKIAIIAAALAGSFHRPTPAPPATLKVLGAIPGITELSRVQHVFGAGMTETRLYESGSVDGWSIWRDKARNQDIFCNWEGQDGHQVITRIHIEKPLVIRNDSKRLFTHPVFTDQEYGLFQGLKISMLATEAIGILIPRLPQFELEMFNDSCCFERKTKNLDTKIELEWKNGRLTSIEYEAYPPLPEDK